MEETGEYDSVEAAKLLLALAYSDGIVLNTTKVQKILYIIYSYYLANERRRLLTESPKAWPYGPVFPRTRKKVDYGVIYQISDPSLEEISGDSALVDNFRKAIQRYSKFSAGQLSEWSHKPGSPWERTTKHEDFQWGNFIPDEYIIEYFSGVDIL